jgi:hypothetical protein
MKKKTDFWLMGLGILLLALFLAPGLSQAKEERWGIEREKLVKELNLAPEKAKEFLAVGEKYDQIRKEIIDRLKKNEGELGKALAEPKPEEAKVKESVAAVTADHDQLFETFKAQRQEETTMLTPVQQGKFIMALKKWHEEMCEKSQQKEKK